MALVPETKMVDIGKLISLGNLLAMKTTWLVLTTTSATSTLSRVFGAYSITRIVYKYTHLPTLILFHIFTYRVNTLFPLWLPERTFSLSPFRLTESTHSSSFLHLTSKVNRHENVWSMQPFSCYNFLVGLFLPSNTEISSNHGKKQTVKILSQYA